MNLGGLGCGRCWDSSFLLVAQLVECLPEIWVRPQDPARVDTPSIVEIHGLTLFNLVIDTPSDFTFFHFKSSLYGKGALVPDTVSEVRSSVNLCRRVNCTKFHLNIKIIVIIIITNIISEFFLLYTLFAYYYLFCIISNTAAYLREL